MLRFAEPVHIQIGHGESDKGGSVSNQHKAYDLTFIGGPAGRDRLARALATSTPRQRIREVGRPQLDHELRRRARLGRRRSGCGCSTPRPGRATGQHRVRVAGQPRRRDHRGAARRPSGPDHLPAAPADRAGLGRARARPTRRIRAALAADGDRHLVDTGPYGWQWRFADALHHRRLGGGVRLAGDRQAAGDHRAGARAPTARRRAAGRAAAAAGRAAAGDVRALLPRCRRVRSWSSWRLLLRRDGRRRPAQSGSSGADRGDRPASQRAPPDARADATSRWRYLPRSRVYKPAEEVHVVVGGAAGSTASGCRATPRSGDRRRASQRRRASGTQMTTVAHSQRGIRRTAYGWAWATSTTQ